MNAFDKNGSIECKDCTSTFATEGGLKIHRGWKHKGSVDVVEKKKDLPIVMGPQPIMLSWSQVELLVDYALREITKKGKG